MVTIPQDFRNPLIDLLEWHLNKFPENPDTVDFTYKRLKRLYEDLCSHRYELNNDTLYFLKDAVYDAWQCIEECGINSEQLSIIDEWVNSQRKNGKT